jgi:hypothetical protein
MRRFFGYGSLVNRETHGYGAVRRARLRGWRRAWAHTALRPVAYLTAVPAPGAEIEGLTAEVPGGDWSGLDAREAAYLRVPAEGLLCEGGAAAVYHIPPGLHGPATAAHPILLSYLDTVVLGYLREFGPGGVARFFATTDGWEGPVRDDRADPVYPRARRAAAAEREMIDAGLARVGARVVRAA